MFFGEQPLHPFLVHFPIALWLFGTCVLIWRTIAGKEGERFHVWLILGAAAVLSLPAVITGQIELGRYTGPSIGALTRHRNLGNLLPWLMLGIVLCKLHSHYRIKTVHVPDWVWCILCLAVAGLVLYTGLLGGSLVYTEKIWLHR